MIYQRKNKAAPRDFIEAMLPVDRKGMFFDCLKQRFDLIFKCGLILLLVSLPFLVVNLWSDLTYISLQESAGNDEAAAMMAALNWIIALIKVPCYALIGIGIASISRILRQLIWAEPVFFFYHCKLGIKQNGKRFFAIFLIYGFLNVANHFVASTLSNSIISYLPIAITIFFFLPIGLYMLSETVFYDVRFAKSFLNGLTLYLKSVLVVLIYVALLYTPLLFALIPYLLIRLLLSVVLILFAVPMFVIAWLLFSCHMFDKFINPGQYPEIIGKGLYKPTDSTQT